MLKDYKENKNKIIGQYNKLLKLKDFFPIKSISSSQEKITLEDIKSRKKALEEEHFFVSFTGQIKAGKSTLINALLFGDEVIPADDTPHTAKITIIKYGEKERLEATFYNSTEWETLEKNTEFYEEFLKEDVEKSIKNGVYKQELISTIAQIKNENGLANLSEYVARDGKYTPFVNLVTLYYPAEILKEITIVDTPGTNDPNKLRDEVAKKWIHKTNANVYVSYAGQAMDKVDIDFIDEFLVTVPKEQKLTVINKIDAINDMDGLDSYLDELVQNESLQRREIVSTKDSLVCISGLGALIDKMITNNKELNEELEHYADKLDEKGFLESENHGLKRLEEAIEEKLIKTKGANIISSHEQFINSIFDKKVQILRKNIAIEKNSLGNLFKDDNDLKDKRESIKDTIRFIDEKEAHISKSFAKETKKRLESFESSLNSMNKKRMLSISSELKKISNYSNYKHEVKWIVKKAIDTNFDELREEVEKIENTLITYTKKEMNSLQQTLMERKKKSLNLNVSNEIFEIYATDLMRGMKDSSDEEFKENHITKIVKENKKFFNTEEGREQVNSGLKDLIEKTFEQMNEDMKKVLNVKIDEHIKEKILSEIIIELKKLLESEEDEITQCLNNMDKKQELIDEVKAKKDLLEQELKNIEKYKSEVI